ncbi:MAG TPA: PASTA domain-containing protein, partial [Solirubrobacteraceae bacterium]|nr:PASTA domain-containing protein [Solirubrobacteraceae bacterium]
MSERTAPSTQASGRAAKPRGGGPSGRLMVGAYVGQPAGEAAQAVRRAGLRPGLDRSFGCEPELVGRVVAQEPPAGSDLARNGLVTLYVAAPGVAQPDEDAVQRQPAPEEPGPALSAPAKASKVSSPQVTRARRRRKPRRAASTARVIDIPLPPIPPGGGERPSDAPTQDAADPTQEWEYTSLAASASAEGTEPADDLADEELVV